jgi:hypothetical protein
MQSLNPNLYKKIEKIAIEVLNDLKAIGVSVPIENTDGSITFGHYTVYKNNGSYTICDQAGYIVVDHVNLPHSAIILANKLSISNNIDNTVLENDKYYGFRLFDELSAGNAADKASKKKEYSRAEFLRNKKVVAAEQKANYKRKILISFNKLSATHR